MFSLGIPVAFVGSRYGSPVAVAPVVQAVMAAGGSVRVGCAPGVDAAVRAACPTAVVFRAASFGGPPAAALAARTRAVVAGAGALVLFPPATGQLGPGSALALRCALDAGLPVWCAGFAPTSSDWQPLALAGVAGFFLAAPPSLFAVYASSTGSSLLTA
jgi:hypothetical protein